MGKIVHINSARKGWVYDEICGIWYDANGLQHPEPEFMILTTEPGPSGLSQLCATFATESEAKQWQIKNGRIRDTRILNI
jgi:hypothetical protein